jgi:hypothetical protein
MSNIHSENDPWSDDSDSGTPLPPKLAAAAREVSENMMETGGDFEIAESIFGKRLSGKATSKKASTLSSRASATPTPSSSSALSYASMAVDSSPSWSAGRATPTPGPRSKPLDAFVTSFQSYMSTLNGNVNEPSCKTAFARIAEEVLRFAMMALKNPVLKDRPLPPGMCGMGLFEVALAMIIAQCGPPPPEVEPTPTPLPPPVEKAARPRSPELEATVTPQKKKKARPLNPALPPTSAASAKAVAAPRKSKPTMDFDAPAKPAAPQPPIIAPSALPSRPRCKGKHTTHGPSRRGIKLTPPAGSSIRAAAITPEILREINTHLKSDVKSDVVLESSSDIGGGIFITASKVPTSAEGACGLKHKTHPVPTSGIVPIKADPATSTSFLKVIDVPHIPALPGAWQLAQRAAFQAALRLSPVGSQLDCYIKYAPRFMRTSPHSGTCVAWIDISDTIAGSNTRNFIGKSVVIGGSTCQIRGAAPRPGSALCTQCMKWGHHSSVCRSKGIRCAHCGGPHTADSHDHFATAAKQDPAVRSCVNCITAKKRKASHSATDTLCPFWINRFNRAWLRNQRGDRRKFFTEESG